MEEVVLRRSSGLGHTRHGLLCPTFVQHFNIILLYRVVFTTRDVLKGGGGFGPSFVKVILLYD